MTITLERELPPIQFDASGALRVGNSRVLLELVIRAFQDGASPESIVQRYTTLSLSDVYQTIGYYLKNPEAIESYLMEREKLAESVRERLSNLQAQMLNERQNSLNVQRDTLTQRLNFWDALMKFRQEHDLEEIDIDPEVFAELRDRSAGREVIL